MHFFILFLSFMLCTTNMHSAAREESSSFEVTRKALQAKLKYKRSLDWRNWKGRNLLMLASSRLKGSPFECRGNYDFARMLLDRGIDVNATEPHAKDGKAEKGNKGATALHFAASRNDPKFIELLLAHGADVDALDDEGQYPLHWAAHGSSEMLECLLKFYTPEQINQVDSTKNRNTLHYVMRSTQGAMAKTRKAEDIYMTPEVACTKIRLLKEHGADLDVVDAYKRTVLHWATKLDVTIFATLLELGAKPNVTDKWNKTVLDVLYEKKDGRPASQFDKKRALLLEYGAKKSQRRGAIRRPQVRASSSSSSNKGDWTTISRKKSHRKPTSRGRGRYSRGRGRGRGRR